jgi:hypothetical protein
MISIPGGIRASRGLVTNHSRKMPSLFMTRSTIARVFKLDRRGIYISPVTRRCNSIVKGEHATKQQFPRVTCKIVAMGNKKDPTFNCKSGTSLLAATGLPIWGVSISRDKDGNLFAITDTAEHWWCDIAKNDDGFKTRCTSIDMHDKCLRDKKKIGKDLVISGMNFVPIVPDHDLDKVNAIIKANNTCKED